MNARHALAAVLISVIAAAPASATVLSASNQAVGTRSSKADYLKVNTVQSELNATMKDINDAKVANGSISADAPAIDGPGYILQKDNPGGDGGNTRADSDPRSFLTPDDGRDTGRLGVSAPSHARPSGSIGNQTGRRGGNGGGGGGGGRHGGGAHGTPEPSTWMLLGAGLALIGGYATLRRRAVVEG